MPDIYYGTIPDDETAKRNEFLQRIRNFWNNSPTAQYYFGQNTQAPTDIINQDAVRRAQIGQTLVSPLAEALRRRQAETGGQKAVQDINQALPPAPSSPAPDQLNMPGLAPPQMPSAPPRQMPQQAPQGQGNLQAYLQQIAAQRQGQQQNMMQLINAALGGQGAREPEMTRKEKIAQMMIPLGATLAQFGGAMMTPPWARGEAMARLGAPLMQAAGQMGRRQDAAAKRQEQRDLKLMAMMPHLMQMTQGPKESPRIYIDKDGNPQMVPYPVQNERAERLPGSYQAAAVDAYQRGDTATGDWYSQKAQEQATARIRYRENLPTALINPDTGEYYEGPPRARFIPRERKEKGAGGFMEAIGGKQGQPPSPAPPGKKWMWVPD